MTGDRGCERGKTSVRAGSEETDDMGRKAGKERVRDRWKDRYTG